MDTSEGLQRAPAADRLDALLWLTVSVVILFTIPIGFVSNDGLGHSLDFAAGTWHLNPNHLLFEPLGAWWQNLWTRHGSAREPVDILKLLSGLAGGLAAGLFRFGVAPRLAASRWAANHATAWLAFSSAFLRLWVSDEIHMIQMPFVVAMAWTAILYLERPSFGRALAIGATAGLAALAFVSNLLIGAALAAGLTVWHFLRREPRLALRSAAGVGLGAVLAAGPILFMAWLRSQGAPAFLSWLTHYGGGRQPARIHEAYGLIVPGGVWRESALRALYGTASALVDLSPAAAAVRDRQAPSLGVILGVIAFLAASAALLYGLRTALREPSHPANRGVLLITSAWLVAILGFGFFWNNSDDQFYFQMAPAFGALAARIPVRRGRAGVFVALSLAGLLWNLVDVGVHRVFYPRQERMALLEKEVRGACLWCIRLRRARDAAEIVAAGEVRPAGVPDLSGESIPCR